MITRFKDLAPLPICNSKQEGNKATDSVVVAADNHWMINQITDDQSNNRGDPRYAKETFRKRVCRIETAARVDSTTLRASRSTPAVPQDRSGRQHPPAPVQPNMEKDTI